MKPQERTEQQIADMVETITRFAPIPTARSVAEAYAAGYASALWAYEIYERERAAA